MDRAFHFMVWQDTTTMCTTHSSRPVKVLCAMNINFQHTLQHLSIAVLLRREKILAHSVAHEEKHDFFLYFCFLFLVLDFPVIKSQSIIKYKKIEVFLFSSKRTHSLVGPKLRYILGKKSPLLCFS